MDDLEQSEETFGTVSVTLTNKKETCNFIWRTFWVRSNDRRKNSNYSR